MNKKQLVAKLAGSLSQSKADAGTENQEGASTFRGIGRHMSEFQDHR